MKIWIKALIGLGQFRGRHQLIKRIGSLLSSRTEIISINGFNIAIDHTDYWCRKMYYGIYEEHLLNFLRKELKEGDVVFDAGANVGYILANCLELIGNTGAIYAFEPSLTCFRRIMNNNDIQHIDNLMLENAALSKSVGIANFFDTPRVISKGFACLEEVNTPRDGLRYKVQTYSIDKYCEENNIKVINFLKLDIEGAELSALLGARKMLFDKLIHSIVIETTINKSNIKLNETNESIFRILESAGYKSYLLKRNGNITPINLKKVNLLRTDILWKLN